MSKTILSGGLAIAPDFELAFCGVDLMMARSNMEQNIAESHLLLDAWVWLEKNRKPVLFGVVAVAAAGLIASTMVWSRKQKEVSAGEALSQALLAQMVSAGGRAEAANNLLKVADSHAGTSGGAQALLLGAGALFASGKHAEAQAQFEKFTREYVGSALAPQAKLGLAACLLAQGKTDDAARAYKDLADRFPNANTAPQARFALGGIYESQGKLEDALSLFEQVARSEQNSSMGSEAGMRAEEIRTKLPPIPMPATTTPATAISTNRAAPAGK